MTMRKIIASSGGACRHTISAPRSRVAAAASYQLIFPDLASPAEASFAQAVSRLSPLDQVRGQVFPGSYSSR